MRFTALAGRLNLRPEADAVAFLAGWEACQLMMKENENGE